MDEAALCRVVGGRTAMREQVQMLLDRAEQSNVVVQILPFDVGAHPALEKNFTLLHFDEKVPDVACVEDLLGMHYFEGASDLSRYQALFEQLVTIALSPEDSFAKLAAVLRRYFAE